MDNQNWTKEEDEAFNEVEKKSNLGKQILKDIQGQPYHWETDAIKAAVLIEREECAKICDDHSGYMTAIIGLKIRARGQT